MIRKGTVRVNDSVLGGAREAEKWPISRGNVAVADWSVPRTKTESLTRTVRVTNERLFVFSSPPIRLAKVFREGCVGYPRRYTIRGSNGVQSRVRTDRSCLPHDKSARHSGALQMTSAPAYNWYVSNQYLDTRDTGYRDSRNVCFWLAVATAAAARSVPQLLGSLQRCSSINYYPSSSRSSPR